MIFPLLLLTAACSALQSSNNHDHAASPPLQCSIQATEEGVSFFNGYFAAKTAQNATAWLSFFNQDQLVFCDAILGECFTPYASWSAAVSALVTRWPPNAPSQILYVAGDTNSAVIHSFDSPKLFGSELRIMSAVDFKDGKVVRQVDYWNGRYSKAASERLPRSTYPYNLGLDTVEETAAPEMSRLAAKLQETLSSGDALAAAALFDRNAVFEDWTLYVRQEGKAAIGRYLHRTLFLLPYGPGATLRHVLGTSTSGGYEWAHHGTDVLNGIVTLEADRKSGLITQMKTVWDASFVPNATLNTLALQALEQATYVA